MDLTTKGKFKRGHGKFGKREKADFFRKIRLFLPSAFSVYAFGFLSILFFFYGCKIPGKAFAPITSPRRMITDL